MAATRVQTAGVIAVAQSVPSIGSAQGWVAPTAGNLLVLILNARFTATLPTGWTAGPSVVDDNAVYSWYKTATGTETTISVTTSGSGTGTQHGLIATEVSGLLATPFDLQTSSTNSAVAGTATTSTSLTTTGANGDWVLAVAGLNRDTTGTTVPTGLTWTNSYTSFFSHVSNPATNGNNDIMTNLAEFNQAAAGATSTNAAWTNAWNARQQLMLAFKLAAGAAAAPIPLLAMART
jgi:hypothetical protein